MDCQKVRRVLPAYREEVLSPELSQDVRRHLAGCRRCATQSEQYSQLRAALRALPVLTPPRHLAISLRILASRERVRRLSSLHAPSFLSAWLTRTGLWAENMMRPVALPMAGGLLSAVILFALLVPTFTLPVGSKIADVPTVLSTGATFLGMGPFALPYDQITVDVTVDRRGSVVDYSPSDGQRAWLKDPEIRRSVENALFFAVISPGTTFGRPASGKVRITLRRSSIDVRG